MAIEIRRVNCLTNLIKCAEGKRLVLKKEFKRQLKHLLENSCVLLSDVSAGYEIAVALKQNTGARNREKTTMKRCVQQPVF